MKATSVCKVVVVVSLLCLPAAAISQGTYIFERMWPSLNLSWNFLIPNGMAIDKSGNLYVADSKTHRIVKLTQDGFYITWWGGEGDDEGKFSMPLGVAVDTEGNVYVSEQGNHRIQKFDSEGHHLTTWGSYCDLETEDGCVDPDDGGPFELGDGQFNVPNGLAVDSWSNVYIADVNNNRIQKFNSNGDYLLTFEVPPDDPLDEPHDVAIDSRNNVYVADSSNNRVLIYHLDGKYVDTLQSCRGFFSFPSDMAIDKEDNIYIAEQGFDNIQKIYSDGECAIEWWDGTFIELNSIAIDKNGYLYATDAGSIQKFTANGDFIIKWSSSGSDSGEFKRPQGVALDTEGFVYVADSENCRIQRFTPDGQYDNQWIVQECDDEQPRGIGGIATDAANNVFLVDLVYHPSIKKFTSGGELLCEWGENGSEEGQFRSPAAIAVDGMGNVFVTDVNSETTRIQKFKPTPDGNHCTDGSGYELDVMWGRYFYGSNPEGDQFRSPHGIAVDDQGNVYITDYNISPRILKYRPTADGTGGFNESGYEFDAAWGGKGKGPGEFISPWAIAVDTENSVYVTDTLNPRIQKFKPTPDDSGYEFDSEWGNTGSWKEGQEEPPRVALYAGQFEQPRGIAVSENGTKVYVSDYGTNRIQVFRKFDAPARPKAIIVAGGGPYPGNSLWDATQVTANFAYLTLLNRGFTKDDIYYLTSDSDVDIDGNSVFDEITGFSDDIYALPTNENLRQAITDAANDNAESLVIYLTDHGDDQDGGTFYLNEHHEPLKARDLALLLDTVEEAIAGEIVVIYDGCQSGSFIDDLNKTNRIIVTSARWYEQAKFLNQGTISFSGFFWTNIFNRFSIGESYERATQAINFYFSHQNPQLTGSADDVYIDFLPEDNEVPTTADAPTIGNISDPVIMEMPVNSDAFVDLYAYNVKDPDGISRVWAEIRPPGRSLGLVSEPLIGQLDTIELTILPQEDCLPEENCYKGAFNRFEDNGLYQIAIYAMDGKGNTSLPQLTTVSLNDTVMRKVIIIAGDEGPGATGSMIETNVRLSYNALISQEYNDDDICFLGKDISEADYEPSMETFRNCINNYAQSVTGDEYLNLVIYLTGEGNPETFTLNDSDEMLYASDLAGLLDDLQKDIPCRVTLIYDANHAGSFISVLTPPPGTERILITSSGENEDAYFNQEGNISFSHFFWGQASIGATLYVSFAYAKNAIAYFNLRKEISFSCYRERGPRLEANGESPPNEAADYAIAQELTIGKGQVFADDNAPPPTIGSVWVEKSTEGIVIAAKDINCYSGVIEKVWAVVKPVSYCPGNSGEEEAKYPEVELTDSAGGLYMSNFLPYDDLPGTYKILVYASARVENGTISVSSPRETKFYQVEGGDIYEDPDGDNFSDDNSSEANVIVPNHPTPQPHNFHHPNDVDWVKFYGVAGQDYIIEANNLENNCPVIVLYHEENLEVPVPVADGLTEEDKVRLVFHCPEKYEGIIYLKIFWNGQIDDEGEVDEESCPWGDDMSYALRVYDGNAGLTATIRGKIKDRVSGKPLDGAVIKSDTTAAISTHGEYDLTVWPDNTKPLSMRSSLNGYRSSQTHINVKTVDTVVRKDIFLDPLDTAECSIDADCDDGIFCNGAETCVNRTCQPGTNPCTDDGLFCNGEETCSEENDVCEHTGSPCPGHLRCVEDGDQCVEIGCSSDADCDDGQFCDGAEVCANGICQEGIDPCADPTPECDEASNLCVEGPSMQVLPNPCIQLRWIPRVMLFRIVGTNTHFDPSSLVTFNPDGAVMALSFLGDEEHLLLISLLMPAWLASEQSIDVTVTTGKEELSETLTIEQLPFIFDGGTKTEKIPYTTDN